MGSCNEITHIVGAAAINKPELKWLTFTDEQMGEGLEMSGIPTHIVANLIELVAGFHYAILREDYKLNTPIAVGKVKLEDFAKEFIASQFYLGMIISLSKT